MTVAPGTRLGHYTIVSPLGAGGMGEVWLADDATLKRKVALKVAKPLGRAPAAVGDAPSSRGVGSREQARALPVDSRCQLFKGRPFPYWQCTNVLQRELEVVTS
jgi:serine/threonine protein kinase